MHSWQWYKLTTEWTIKHELADQPGAARCSDLMDMGGSQMMAVLPEWSLGYGLVIFVMWAVMMLAMMLPSVAPVTLLIASLCPQARRRGWRGARQHGVVRTRLSRCLACLCCCGDHLAMGAPCVAPRIRPLAASPCRPRDRQH